MNQVSSLSFTKPLILCAKPLILCILFGACKPTLEEVARPEVELTPQLLTMSAPPSGEQSVIGRLTLSHVKGAELIVSQVKLVEYGSLRELSLIDGDDWADLRLSDGASRSLDVLWTPRDHLPDQASVIFTTNIGQLEARVETADLDADYTIEAEGEWAFIELESGHEQINIEGIAPGSRGETLITVRSIGLAPLILTPPCLAPPGERCSRAGTEVELSPFSLCGSAFTNGCTPVEPPAELATGESFSFSLRYLAPELSVDSDAAQLIVSSNAASRARQVINVSATPCVIGLNAERCNVARCGDGVVQGDEVCDDGNDNDEDACRTTCELNVCGDGVVNRGVEACDDANTNNNDACLDTCEEARCGDGYLWDGVEVCDDGDDDNTDRCLIGCTLATCGDGFVWRGVEACDDGNDDNEDSCSSLCEETRCGDGVVQSPREECDFGVANGEGCDYGEETCEVCSLACMRSEASGDYCGDGVVNGPEECDLGGVRGSMGEQCEYGAPLCVWCNPQCRLVESLGATCGDRVINGPEECDGQEGCTEVCTLSADAPPCAPHCPPLNWVSLSALSFELGAEGYSSQEAPTHLAQVRAFSLTQSEVTLAQYRTCVTQGVCSQPRDRNANALCNWGNLGREDHPLNCVTWGQARVFAQWVGGDLPSEAQWERAARGDAGRGLFPWSTSDQSLAPSCEVAVIGGLDGACGRMGTEEVCAHPSGHSAEGICDLIGNVWEWTLDAYSPYEPTMRDDAPRCLTSLCDGEPMTRTLRGGGWNTYASGWRATIREGYSPQSALNFFGFRVARPSP